MNPTPSFIGAAVAVAVAPATHDQLESLVVALVALLVREGVSWLFRRRNKS